MEATGFCRHSGREQIEQPSGVCQCWWGHLKSGCGRGTESRNDGGKANEEMRIGK
jgi:hypothetical protein